MERPMSNLKGKSPDKMSWEKKSDKGYTHLSQLGFYATTRWKKVRKYVLTQEPLCRECLFGNKVRPATIVDHIVPISEESSDELKFGLDNLQPICDYHHRVKTNNDKRLGKSSQDRLRGRQLMDFLSK